MTLSAELQAQLAGAGLDPAYVEAVAKTAVTEDLGDGLDVTSVATAPFDAVGVADFVARADGVVAGLPVAAAVLQVVAADDVVVDLRVNDGSLVRAGDVVLAARGLIRTLLTAERSALNLLCHLSGVASLTRRWVNEVTGTGAVIRDTRKTTPGLRRLEKYAVRCGGGVNHRMCLADAALVKDNHVLAAGGVAAAFRAVRAAFPALAVEVECDTPREVEAAVAAGADLVLLDNMSLDQLRRAVAVCRPAGVRTEASGGLTLQTARAVAETGVDYLAVGALTHSAPVLDIGVDLRSP